MRVLLLGSDTPLGLAILEFLEDTGRHETVTLTRAACRWRSERQAKKAVQRARANILVDARIQSQLDAGQDPLPADVEACHWLGKACQRQEVTCLYISSWRLFSGRLDRLYSEKDPADADTDAGAALLAAEQAVAERCDAHVVVRLGPVFASRGDNWFANALRSLAVGEANAMRQIPRGTPVAAADAARVISAILDQLSVGAMTWGVFHYTGSDRADAGDLEEVMLAAAGQYLDIDTASTGREPMADRPPITTLDCRKIRDTFAIKQVSWRDAMTNAVKQYFRATSEENK